MRNTRSSTFTALIATACIALCVGMSVQHESYAQESLQIKGPKNTTDQFSGTVYGPITSDDTLWRIAERYRQNKNLTVYQVMAAIYDLNPNAFEQQNINAMVDGAMLNLPSERYVARFDAEQAKQRAELDQQSWSRAVKESPKDPVKNLKPLSPPVNQADLTSTKNALEQRLNSLDQNQTQQFDALQDQFAQSISSVESLLEDNKKLYERIDQVDADLGALRERVEGDVQSTMNAQTESIEEMLNLLKSEQQKRDEEAASNPLKALTDPIVLTVLSAVLTLSLLVGIGAWLLKKKPKPEPEAAVVAAPAEAVPVPEPDEPIGDDLLGDPVDDLGGIHDDELFNDDDLLDDVLSSELEDSLDDELENFADLSDEMLVPDSDGESKGDEDSVDDLFEEGDSELAQDDLDSLFDQDDDDDGDGFDISGEDESLTEALTDEDNDAADSEGLDEISADDGIDAEIETPIESSGEELSEEDLLASIGVDMPDEEEPAPVEEVADEEPEISIDDLLEETQEKQDIAEKLGVEDNNLDEEMIEKIDDEIKQQNQELDNITDNIINEIEQLEMMGGMLDEMDDEEEIETPDANADGIQDIEALAEDLDEIEIQDMENAEEFAEPIPDDLIDELAQDDDDIDAILAEASDKTPASDDKDVELEPEENESDADSLADELLSELEAEDSESDADALSDELLNELEPEETESDADSLADELLSELEAEDSESDADPVADDLSDEIESETPETDTDENVDEVLSEIEVEDIEAEADIELSEAIESEDDIHIEDLDAFSEQMLSDLDDIDDFELEQEQDGVVPAKPSVAASEELADVPGLDDWLSEEDGEADTSILNELEHADFDDLLSAIDDEEVDSVTEEKSKPTPKLDNPDLDLEALFSEELDSDSPDDDFLSVDDLLEEAEIADEPAGEEEFDLDVSLSDFTGETSDEDLIDVDLDSGNAANLDLARAYIDMDDYSAARGLLLEVLEQGTDEQKQEAQSLLNEIGDA